MNRKAIVIECSAIPGQDRLPGAVADAQAWSTYLLSNQGGAWRSSEVEILSNPSKQVVKSKIASITSGYAFITYSGHGFVDGSNGQTKITLSDGNLSENELIASCRRTSIILDSCRGVVTASFAEAYSSMTKTADTSSAYYRNAFDLALLDAEEGVCTLYGCAFEQAAQESKAGGAFTQAMINSGATWRGTKVFSLKDAFTEAQRAVSSKTPQQTPQAHLGRRLTHFPFAVRP